METAAFTNSIMLARKPGVVKPQSTDKPFIQANTVESTFEEIRENHIIPVFIKDNEPVISQTDFIQITLDLTNDMFPGEAILEPNIRLSHPIKGRIPEAKDKPASALFEHEKTLYYERMAFIIELPGISDNIDGNELNLTIGGIKAYNLDNLYARKGTEEHFKVFIGFQNKVCTNLCVWTDGLLEDLRVKSLGELKASIRSLLLRYNQNYHLFHLKRLTELSITEQQFAQLVGRCRMYPHLPNNSKASIDPLLFGDTQIGNIVKDYYQDDSFCRDDKGDINLWRLYNLFTGANKSSYIDTFITRSVNAYCFTEQLRFALENKFSSWYLS